MDRTRRFFEMKRAGEPISALTAYDAQTARVLSAAGLDILLVGDSVGTNVLGYGSEREVTLDDIAHHTRAVRRGAPEATILADLPYATYETPEQAATSARRLADAGADMVKFEGPRPEIARAIIAAGIAVSGHLGLEPQHHEVKRLKAKTARDALSLENDAKLLDEAGIGLLILELIPAEIAARITKRVAAPTIGIGAGGATDGQVLVINDAIGINDTAYRHNRRFGEAGRALLEAATRYRAAVRDKSFPTDANAFRMPAGELASLEGEAGRDAP